MLFEEIKKLNSELFNLNLKFLCRQQELKKLKIGQEIYTQSGGGYLEPNEYYPVIVVEIDHDRARVLVHEQSLDDAWHEKERYIETFITELRDPQTDKNFLPA